MLIKRTPHIAISIGDFNGIGPEVVLKSLSQTDLNRSTPVILSPRGVIEQAEELLSTNCEFNFVTNKAEVQHGVINIIDLGSGNLNLTPGIQSAQSGEVAMKAIQHSIELCLNKHADAMVTAPISKEAVNLGGFNIPGHTEYLAAQTNTKSVLMMLVSGDLRVALVTAHIPVSAVASAISEELITTKFKILSRSLINDFGIPKPKIAIMGLNPHSGDGGIIGREETEIITPAIKKIRQQDQNFTVNGPFPADGFFGQKLHTKYDAILAMYHDQGLVPFKLLSFGTGVNFTAGLPIIRTSPDHGTAFDIAGKGIADPSSFKEAYNLAVELAKKRIRED